MEGAEDFARVIEQSPEEHRATLRRLSKWAMALERDGLARPRTYQNKTYRTLSLRLPAEDRGLVAISNDKGAGIGMWRSVFEQRALQSLTRIEQLIAPTPLRNGTTLRTFSEKLLDALTQAYREAAGGQLTTEPGRASLLSDAEGGTHDGAGDRTHLRD